MTSIDNIYYDTKTTRLLYRHHLLLIQADTRNAIAYPLAYKDDKVFRMNLRSSTLVPLIHYDDMTDEKKAEVEGWWNRWGRQGVQVQINKVDKRSTKEVE